MDTSKMVVVPGANFNFLNPFPYQVAVVTGAGHGIGRCLALQLAKLGVNFHNNLKLIICNFLYDNHSRCESLVGTWTRRQRCRLSVRSRRRVEAGFP